MKSNCHQMKWSEIKPMREELLQKNEGKCPICEREIPEGKACLDHSHQSGKIRDTLCSSCNQLEGAIRSKWIRYGMKDDTDLVTILINMAKHLLPENEKPFIHPSEVEKKPKLQKRSYNELEREIERVNTYRSRPIKMPPYPKSGRLTKRLKELYEKFGIKPKFYSK